MKKLLINVVLLFGVMSYAYAAAEVKEVCKEKKDKAGKIVKGKDGKPILECKKIKVHRKYDGTKVPENNKK
jgi:type III secretory pathway component EscU